MPSVVLLTGGHKLEVLVDPEEAERVLGDAHKTASGFAVVETDTGKAFPAARARGGNQVA